MIEPRGSKLHGHTYHDVKWLVVGICGLSISGWLINSYNPDSNLILSAFFVTLFITISSIAYFVTNIVRRSLLTGSGVFGFFFLRYLGLRELIYIILMIACLLSLEFYFNKK